MDEQRLAEIEADIGGAPVPPEIAEQVRRWMAEPSPPPLMSHDPPVRLVVVAPSTEQEEDRGHSR